jgi:hypothetical protein
MKRSKRETNKSISALNATEIVSSSNFSWKIMERGRARGFSSLKSPHAGRRGFTTFSSLISSFGSLARPRFAPFDVKSKLSKWISSAHELIQLSGVETI